MVRAAIVMDAIRVSQGAVVLLPSLLLLLAAEAGFRLGLRLFVAKDVARREQIAGIEGAVLGMLGLLLGFTFSMAASRYEARRNLVVQEANAIGTTFLRAALLAPEHRGPVEDVLRRYVDLRLGVQPSTADESTLARARQAGAELQRTLWGHAIAASREAPTPITASFLSALNQMIDLGEERVAAARNDIPWVVWLLVLGVAWIGCFTAGYAAGAHGERSWLSAVMLPLLVAIVIGLIADLASPRRGFISVSQQPLADLRASMEPS
jgi:hypothetical protein